MAISETTVWKIIVLGLMLFVNTSAQQRTLETGYDYAGELVENGQLHKDLKCGYLFGGCTQMRLFKLLLDRPYCTELKVLVGPVAGLNKLVRYQINSLYGLRGIRVGAMWLLCLFTGLMEIHYRESDEPAVDFANFYETLVYVIGKLEAELVGCAEGNSFDNYTAVLRSTEPPFDAHAYNTVILAEHLEKAGRLVKSNRDGFLLAGPRVAHTKIHSLVLANLGADDRLIYDFQNVYNLQIEWNQTGAVLSEAWAKARYLDWHITGLDRLKAYYIACFDFLKVVMVSLTLKHLKYLQAYTDVGSESNLHYAQKWYKIVVRFGAALSLSEDLHVSGLLNTVRNLIECTQTLDSVVEYLNAILMTLCRAFKCQTNNNVSALDRQEYKIPHKSLTDKEMKYLRVVFDPVPIKYNSLANARTFLTHLQLAFKYVNFGTIRSLMEYIDQLKRTNCVDSSEDYTEELENLHLIDSSEYD